MPSTSGSFDFFARAGTGSGKPGDDLMGNGGAEDRGNSCDGAAAGSAGGGVGGGGVGIGLGRFIGDGIDAIVFMRSAVDGSEAEVAFTGGVRSPVSTGIPAEVSCGLLTTVL